MLVLAVCWGLFACAGDEEDTGGSAQAIDPLTAEWEDILAQAEGSTVTFYMYGGWAHVNDWIDTYVAGELKTRYNITLERVPMDAAVFVNKLLTEKAAGQEQGSIDMMWINGENFRNAMEAELLFGPYAEKLPNFQAYVDPDSVAYDFGFPTNGYESPYGKAQFVFEYDSDRVENPPRSYEELLAWVEENPGRFTYPQPPDFTGSAFIRQAFYAVSGGHEPYMTGFDQALFDQGAGELWDYLQAMRPHLWQEGSSYPKDSAALDTLFARGEVDLNMSYHPIHAQSKIIEGTYPETVRTLVMAEGSIYNIHYTAIAANAPNPAGAMVVADFLLSPEAQLSKLDPANWGDFPVLDPAKLPEDIREAFAALDLGQATLPVDDLVPVAVPEVPSDYVEALEKGWDENVLQ
ncbi:MAG: ABC transporter substrate-binding protein [Desulfovibrio sp.]|nr:MAG: ABC transporter substrate-binding protein [Desulfovibrio sp.]